MTNNDRTETTLRAVVDGNDLRAAKIPDPLVLTRHEAEAIAAWARPFSGTCLTDIDIHVSDIRASSAIMNLTDLNAELAKKIKPILLDARKYGFGLRVMRELSDDPYELSIYRRVIDVPQLTVPFRSMKAFLQALGFISLESGIDETTNSVNIDVFADRLSAKAEACMYGGVDHYREFCHRIVEYGRANGAREITWCPERRGAVPAAAQEGK